MAEPVKSENNGAVAPKEMSMEVRLLLAFLLMGAVMFLSPYFFKSTAPPSGKKSDVSTNSVPPVTAPPADSSPAAAAPAPAEPAPKPAPADTAPAADATSQQPQPPLIIDTDLYKVTLSNQGATVRSWLLKNYKGNDGKPLELVNTSAKMEYPFALSFSNEKPTANVNWTYYKQTPEPDGLGVSFEYSDGHTTVHKKFQFQKTSYLSNVTTDVTIDGRPIQSMIEWRGGFGDLTVTNPAGNQNAVYYDQVKGSLKEIKASAAKNGPVSEGGNFAYAGVADSYFAAVFLPEHDGAVQQTVFSDTVRTPLEEKPAAFPGSAVSAAAGDRFSLFVGPKDVDLLKRTDPKLESLVNFGFFSIIAKPLFVIMNWMNDSFVHNFGWAIVLITVFLYIVMFPLRLSSMKSMRKMQALKPQIDAINAKYKSLKFNDPKKADQQQETMDLYKKNGVNPMGGCLPMVIQLVLIWPFYQVCRVAVEMRGAHWLWVTDLSQPETLPIRILPILMIVTQFLSTKMMPTPSADPSQQRMMMLMPLIFGFMFYQLPSGLVLYYVTGTVVSIAQQLFFNRTETAQEAVRSVQPAPKKKNGRK